MALAMILPAAPRPDKGNSCAGDFNSPAPRPGRTIPAMDPIRFRDQFPVTRRWAFMDHAAVAPLSAPAQSAVLEWADDVVHNGVVNERRWLARIEEVRRLFAR